MPTLDTNDYTQKGTAFETAQTFEATAETYSPTEQFAEPTLDTAAIQESTPVFEGAQTFETTAQIAGD